MTVSIASSWYPIHFSYGLLGASGCGKTTVLSVMVGRRGVSDGRVSVLGGVPGDRRTGVPGSKVGYMPQVRLRKKILFISQHRVVIS